MSGNGIDQSRTTSYTANRGQLQSPSGGPVSSDDTDPISDPAAAANTTKPDLNQTAKFIA